MSAIRLSRNALLGAWRLVSFSAREPSGAVRHPLGEQPAGMILYTDAGYMSAQLASAPDAADYIAYGGPFELDEHTAVVHHDIAMSSMPELLDTPQYRNASVDGEFLTLSATTTDAQGLTLESTLVWKRADRIER